MFPISTHIRNERSNLSDKTFLTKSRKRFSFVKTQSQKKQLSQWRMKFKRKINQFASVRCFSIWSWSIAKLAFICIENAEPDDCSCAINFWFFTWPITGSVNGGKFASVKMCSIASENRSWKTIISIICDDQSSEFIPRRLNFCYRITNWWKSVS